MREPANHVIQYYIEKSIEYISGATSVLSNGAVAMIKKRVDTLAQCEREMERAALAGDVYLVRQKAREWCLGWKKAVVQIRGDVA